MLDYIKVPATTPSEAYLQYITDIGIRKKYGDNLPQDVIDRLNTEYGVIIPNRFSDYILIIWDIHEFCRTPERVRAFCKKKGIEPPPDGIIPIGPGRGSVGGSIVCYAIGIHKCDPLLFNLYFERFLNPERIAYPDIDFDISQRYRHIGLAYIADTYGVDHVSQIITFGTLSCKTALHDVLVAARVSNSVINEVKSTIPDEPKITFSDVENDDKFIKAMQSIPFPDAMVTVDQSNINRITNSGNKLPPDVMKDIMPVVMGIVPSVDVNIKSTWTWQKALSVMKSIEKLSKNESMHAAGVVIAPTVLADSVPLMCKDGHTMICQYDMRSVEEIGFLKMDCLGLRTVDVNHDCCRLIREWHDPSFDMDNIPYNDADTIKMINDGDTVGIFQIESTGFTQMMQQIDIGGKEVERFKDRRYELLSTIEKTRGLEIKDFMWISAGIALYRPGPLDAVIEGKTMVQHLIDRKLGKEPIMYLFPEEKSYLEETYGVLVYQEQVMARVRAMTGCTLGRADILRKAMGKKNPVLMKEQMDWFKGAASKFEFTKANINKEQIIERAAYEITTFSRYGFNKAHTVEYGHICYYNAYFKKHYPAIFYTALLNSESDPKRHIIIIRDMLNHGIQLLPPTINDSHVDFTLVDDSTIRFGLSAIKNMGKNAMPVIMEDRAKRGRFESVDEFRIRIPATVCNITGMSNLAKCGAFDEFIESSGFGNRASLVESLVPMCNAIKKHTAKKPKKPAPTVDEVLAKYHDGKITYEYVKAEDDVIQYAIWEKEILKYYISAHPIDAYEDEIRRWTAIQDVEMDQLPDEFYIAGFVEGCHETIIKKEGRNKGKPMGFITIGTAFRTYEGTMFPGIYESCLPYIKDGEPVVMKGKRNTYKDAVTIQVEYLRKMSNSGIRDCPECHIRLHSVSDIMNLMALRQMFNEYPGMTKVIVHVIYGHNDLSIACRQPISLNDRIIGFVESFADLSYKPN